MTNYPEFVHDFAEQLINTHDVANQVELFGNVDELIEFAGRFGVEGSAGADDLVRLRAARARLRHALVESDAVDAVEQLNGVLGESRPNPRLVQTEDGWRFAYSDRDAGIVDQLLAAAAGQLLEEVKQFGLERVSTCHSSTCEDVFIDLSRNPSRMFCSPSVCGNRESQRAYRARQTGTA
jgi:predicted RNA-binding Zn ribbon-like protein